MNRKRGVEFDPAGLLVPAAYPWPVETIEFIETHISWLFLTDDRVLKIKRPVHFPFVDHRSFESRARSCHDEVDLNRRLTTGVYLDVVPIVRKGEGYAVGGDGEVVEWGTLMRRLPADGMLDQLIGENAVTAGLGLRIGEALRRFHDDAPVCATDPDNALMQMKVVADNLDEIADVAADVLSVTQCQMVRDVVRSFLDRNGALFRSRVTDGFVRDGHGDLRTDHICIDENDDLQIFDCIEFNADLRCADIASDLAFLLMDLQRLDREDLAAEVLTGYGADETVLPAPLLRLYQTHRALVKVKTECLTLASAGDEAGDLQQRAARFLDAAFRAAIHTGPCVVVMTGLSGTGKSTVARQLVRVLGAAWLRTDEIREEIGASAGLQRGWQKGAFTAEWTARTYAELFRRAEDGLVRGEPVVLDGAFLDQDARNAVRDLALRAGAPALLIETTGPEDVVRKRLEARAKEGLDPSRATVEIYARQLQEVPKRGLYVPDGMAGVVVDTTAPAGMQVEEVWKKLREIGVFTPAFEDADE